ncbi:MAG: heme biosynthesis protein HemY [Legionellales bacterium RIFCSPHIGHO2_12_FULL_42_9]|nr:MAG: heme biosynthesis protein HemY [Legionellales bacterium RIFCSPHIGHO2_12_FULL_42_9]
MSNVGRHVSKPNEVITLSEAARAHVVAYLAGQKDSQGIRLSVKKTGCSGLSYVVDRVFTVEESDLVFPLTESYTLFVDKSSYPFLKGMTIDYVKEGFNYKFVFNNPNQSGECGCGESFTVD